MKTEASCNQNGGPKKSAHVSWRARLLWSAALCGLTYGVVVLLSRLESVTGLSPVEMAQYPGVWVSSLAFPTGIHDSHPKAFLILAVLANALFYFAVWFLVLIFIARVLSWRGNR